jgi:putative sigma-54 modulation protein
MQWVFETHHYELTDFLRERLEHKLAKLEKMLPQNVVSGEVNLRQDGQVKDKQNYRAEIMLTIGNSFIGAKDRGPNMEVAFDQAWDKFKLQLTRFRDRQQDHRRQGADKQVRLFGELREIRRQKKLELQPMYPAEAIEQMELLDHDFYLFLNRESSQVNLVYRRDDGHFGVMEVKE